VKKQSEIINNPDIDINETDLFLQIDFLQEKVKKLDEKEEKFEKFLNQKEKELEKFKEKLYDYNFDKQSSIDLIDQLNHIQNLLLKKNKEYDSLNMQHKSLINEVSIIHETLDKYKKLSIKQNEEILRAMDLIKKKRKLNQS